MKLARPKSGLPAGVSAEELFQSSPDGMVVTAADGTILAVNDSLLELLGHSREALLGRSVDVLVPAAVRERHAAHRRMFSTAPSVRGMGAGLDLSAVSADGELIPVDLMIGPLPSAGDGCVLAAVRDVRERRNREADWEHRALHDPLTGLANRSLVVDRMEQASLRALRTGGEVGVFFLDLDGFKGVNDVLGHAAGDEVLVVVAQRLLAETRQTDTVGRLGGDEFVVVVEKPSVIGAEAGYVERLRRAVSAPISVAGKQVTVGVSIGAAVGGGNEDWATLLELADRRMFEDKATRRLALS